MNPAIASELASNNPVLGQRDLATEQRFGMVGFASSLFTNIRTHALQDMSREDGGWLVGYEEGGVRKVVDVLWVQSTGRVDVGEFDIFTGEEELPNRLSQLSQNYPGRELLQIRS